MSRKLRRQNGFIKTVTGETPAWCLCGEGGGMFDICAWRRAPPCICALLWTWDLISEVSLRRCWFCLLCVSLSSRFDIFSFFIFFCWLREKRKDHRLRSRRAEEAEEKLLLVTFQIDVFICHFVTATAVYMKLFSAFI